MTESRGRSLLWIGALALTLAVLAADSAQRLASIRELSARRAGVAPEPAADARSPSGYASGQHRVILPAIDGYHWILQTEAMLAGYGLRIRQALYDDAPSGREVHWAGLLRWWTAGLAAAHGVLNPELSAAQSLERVAPWANTTILVLVLLCATPLLARRLGAPAAACFALGTVAVFPFYEYFVVGYLDHHGVATMAALLVVLCLAAGSGGWTRVGDHGARPWFDASAACGAVGLWVSAATVLPVLAGVGLGALVAGRLVGDGDWRGRSATPALWRRWGLVGGALSLVLYLLEYFPGHLGLRLEVNHPLYALAWVAGGDLIARLSRTAEAPRDRGALWIGLDALALALVPALFVLLGERAFRLSDPFLYTLHQRFIVEFLPLGPQLASMGPRVIAGRASALPLVALPLAAALWPTSLGGAARVAWRAVVAVAVAVALAFAHVVLTGLLDGRLALVILLDAALLGTGVALARVRGERELPAPARAVLALALVPAALLLAMSLVQVRWVGVAAALWLGVLVTAAGALRGAGVLWSWSRRAFLGALLAVVFVVAPALFLTLPLDESDPPQEVARDASWWLRRRLGDQPAVVFTSPNATTWMAYFGGLPGVGTLYWENADGLEAATAIYTAPTPDSLRHLLAERGVTHVVLYPWDRGLELLRIAREEAGAPPGAEPYLAALQRALRSPGVVPLPAWLSPLPYRPPEIRSLGHPSALILEVVPDQPAELTLLRLAELYKAWGAPAESETALRASLGIRPTAGAFALLTQLEASRNARDAALEALTGMRTALALGDTLALEDRVNTAIAFAIARDGAGAARELNAALASADDRALRRLPADQLEIVVRLARQLGLDRAHPETIRRAEALLGGS